MSDSNPSRFSDGEKALLLDTAADALEFAVLRGGCMQTVPERYPPSLRARTACFVSLHREGALRGCVGSLEARRPLVADVAANTAAAARDDRFPPVRAEEIEDLVIELSVLTPPKRLRAATEAEVRAALRPGVHGVILQAGGERATFLPSVWAQVSGPEEFLSALKEKAGWPRDFWSPEVRVYTYETERISQAGSAP